MILPMLGITGNISSCCIYDDVLALITAAYFKLRINSLIIFFLRLSLELVRVVFNNSRICASFDTFCESFHSGLTPEGWMINLDGLGLCGLHW